VCNNKVKNETESSLPDLRNVKPVAVASAFICARVNTERIWPVYMDKSGDKIHPLYYVNILIENIIQILQTL
jgi:hypothetical protein